MSGRSRQNSAQAALDRLKEAKKNGKSKTALDTWDDEDLYEEDDYQTAQGEDEFIVDDGNDLGYGDDGEEHWDDYEYDEEVDVGQEKKGAKKGRKKGTAAEPVKNKAISKAFLTNRRVAQMNSRLDDQSGTSTSTSSTTKKSKSKSKGMDNSELDKLMEGLDDDSEADTGDMDEDMFDIPSSDIPSKDNIALYGQSSEVNRAKQELLAVNSTPISATSMAVDEPLVEHPPPSIDSITTTAYLPKPVPPTQNKIAIEAKTTPKETAPSEPTLHINPASLPKTTPRAPSNPSKRTKVVVPPPTPPPATHSNTRTVPDLSNDTLSMYWLDAFYDSMAAPDKLYLTGKAVSTTPNCTANVCITVNNLERNVFVLPREECSFAQVYEEISALCQRKGIAEFKCKPVERNICFDKTEDMPPSAQFLKLVYSAQYPPLSHSTKGKTFSSLSGTDRSPLELFLLKRNLRGPCWIDIALPPSPSTTTKSSWSSFEYSIPSPKSITVCASQSPSPPLSAVVLDIQTVLNPLRKHNEIVLISVVVHPSISIDGPTPLPNCKEGGLPLDQYSLACYPKGCNPVDLQQLQLPANTQFFPSERALLPRFFNLLKSLDPDILLGHKLSSLHLPLLLQRAQTYKLTPLWSTLGRLRRRRMPSSSFQASRTTTAGRLVCDTLTSAKEFVRQVDYQLESLAKNLLQQHLVPLTPSETPDLFKTAKGILHLMDTSLKRAHTSLALSFHLVALPLTKQLTNLCGNLWSGSLRSSRAERVEYLLLHEFHRLKYIVPENQYQRKDSDKGKEKEKGPKYQGGLVLEPKRGFYDQFILLLDFNSLYPSIIQEYDLCFTTQPYWKLPGAPEEYLDQLDIVPDVKGVLPRILQHLLQRRKSVKTLLKKAVDPLKKQQLDVRQKALKLVANALYGCLGFSSSRFHCRPLAALITALGRATLSNTVELSSAMGYEVVYGDTDSIMVNTKSRDLQEAKRIGGLVKKEVNKIYNKLEIDIDGIYKSMLLLRKKKYAALAVVEDSNGTIGLVKEMKGLDLVRRDWCPLSKEIGTYIVDQLLSGNPPDDIVEAIQTALEQLALQIRAGSVPTQKFVITKSLTRPPSQYADIKAHPHVVVAQEMVQSGRSVSVGDHIPFVITTSSASPSSSSSSISERAHHPYYFTTHEKDQSLQLDYEWYITHQILAPVGRLCEPIPGLEQAAVANALGLEGSKYTNSTSSSSFGNSNDTQEFAMDLYEYDDQAAFKDIAPLVLECGYCNQSNPFPGLLAAITDQPLLACPTKDCPGLFKEEKDVARAINRIRSTVNHTLSQYFLRIYRCDEHSCEFSQGTRHTLHNSSDCPKPHCSGKLFPEVSVHKLYQTMRYLQLILDTDRALLKATKASKPLLLANQASKPWLGKAKVMMDGILKQTSHHWVEPQQVFASIISS